MFDLGSLGLSKLGSISSFAGIATNVLGVVTQGVQDINLSSLTQGLKDFSSNPFANIAKTGTIDGNNAKNQQIIVNNGNINIGDNTGNVGNVDSNKGNVSEKSGDENIIQKFLAFILQLLSGEENQNEFAGNIFGQGILNMLG